MTKGRSIRLFLADGTPGGIITAEIMNWTGHAMFAPRSRLADLIKRAEAARTGVYFLTGLDPEGGFKSLVYVGETDNVGKRLAQHNKDESKDFWDQACVITSKDQNLTKAHVRYLESRLIAIATEAGRAKLVNGTAPDYGLLPEADIADMEFFIEQVCIILPVLGLEFLREPPKLSAAFTAPAPEEVMVPASPLFELISKKHGLHAEAREIDGDFVVMAGSLARGQWCGMENQSYHDLHRKLYGWGVLTQTDDDNHLSFSHDYAFRSPSAAAAVIFGRASNGRKEWCLKGTKTTYADWQEEQVAAVSPEGNDE